MLNLEQKQQFSELLEALGETMDVPLSQYDTVVTSYKAVGEQLSGDSSALAPYEPEILPQGSFLLGTMIKPIHEDDELDIDLVCRLTGKKPEWTQDMLKQIVGRQLKANDVYKQLLNEPEGRRCWTLNYRRNATDYKYHLDILPCILDTGYKLILEKSFSNSTTEKDIESMAVRLTDSTSADYETERDHLQWLKSNPFGYSIWFSERASLHFEKAFSINESIQPVPKHDLKKLPLQRVVQILKRHRDMMFNGDENKPISVIITTLAAMAYQKEEDVLDALINVVNRMPSFIIERQLSNGKKEQWVANPVNECENFADKWPTNAKRQENFHRWLTQVKKDVDAATQQRGIHLIAESLRAPFGGDLITKAFSEYGSGLLKRRESGALRMAAASGSLSEVGRTPVPPHRPFGIDE
jgi:hypothetical protein